MSLLPNTILFPSMPFARVEVDEQGRVKEGGLCIIDQNWWLFLYNLSQNVLGTPGKTSLPASALIEIASLEADADDADAIVLRQGIANAAVQALQPQDVVISDSDLPSIARALMLAQGQDATLADSDLPSIARALLLAQDALLPDPPPAAQPVKSITVGASPFTYTAPFNGNVVITGGTVSAISIIRQGTTIATGLTTGLIPVSRGDQVQITYTVLPTGTFIPT